MTTQLETLDTFLDLEPVHHSRPQHEFVVIHPLHDAPEAKCDADRLGPMKLGRASRIALGALRFYLVAIMLMGAYRVATLAGALRR